MSTKIGILTGGGDCPGLNAVIRAVVKSAAAQGWESVGILGGFEGLLEPRRTLVLDSQGVGDLLAKGGTILGTASKGRFSAKTGLGEGRELAQDLFEGVRAGMEALGLSALVSIGGDGSLSIALQMHEHGIPIVGVPKTIDNDVQGTFMTFGFDSAVACATDALDRLKTTAESHERVMVLEVMGRNAGWIALFAGIAGGADAILIPEIPFDYEVLCDRIRENEAQGRHYSLVVVAEGAHAQGEAISESAAREADKEARLGGIGARVTDEIARRTGKEARTCVLGHLQRGGTPTNFDRALCTMFGAHAVELLAARDYGKMVAWAGQHVVGIPLQEAVGQLKLVRPEGHLCRTARALGVSFGDRVEGPA